MFDDAQKHILKPLLSPLHKLQPSMQVQTLLSCLEGFTLLSSKSISFSVAFKVLELQRHGKSTHTAYNISFNNICAHFKLPENPLKEKFKNILWKMENSYNNNLLNNEAPLTEEVIFYSAFDAYPLHRSGCRHQ